MKLTGNLTEYLPEHRHGKCKIESNHPLQQMKIALHFRYISVILSDSFGCCLGFFFGRSCIRQCIINFCYHCTHNGMIVLTIRYSNSIRDQVAKVRVQKINRRAGVYPMPTEINRASQCGCCQPTQRVAIRQGTSPYPTFLSTKTSGEMSQ